MIVIGVDVHKHSLTAVAVDELGRPLAEWSGPVDAQVPRRADRANGGHAATGRGVGVLGAEWPPAELEGSHVIMVSQPEAVTNLILEAIEAVS